MNLASLDASRVPAPQDASARRGAFVAPERLGFLAGFLLAASMLRILFALTGPRLPELFAVDTSLWQRYVAVAALVGLLGAAGRVLLLLARGWPLALWMLLLLVSAAYATYSSGTLEQMRGLGGTIVTTIAFAIAFQRSPTTALRLFCVTELLFLAANAYYGVFEGARVDISGDIRWIGLTAHPNTLGGAACIAVTLGGYLMFFERHKAWRLVGALTVATAFYCIRGADSVTSGLAGSLSLLGMAFFYLRRNRPRVQIAREVLALAALAACFVSLAVFVMSNEAVRSFVFTALGRDPTFSGREQLWRANLEFFTVHPWLGWGFASPDSKLPASQAVMLDPHSGYIRMLVGAGLVGLLGLLPLLFHAFRKALGMLAVRYEMGALGICFFGSFLVHNLTESSLGSPFHAMWMMFGAVYFSLLALPAVPQRRVAGPEGPRRPDHMFPNLLA